MGYYTHYQINIEDTTGKHDIAELTKQIVRRLEEISRYSSYYSCGGFIDMGDIKWYDYEDDMDILSREFPDVFFRIDGDGESSEDLWTSYWKNGMYQLCQAVIPPYDPRKMTQYKSYQGKTDATDIQEPSITLGDIAVLGL